MICPISLTKFSDVLPAITFASAIGNFWRIYFGVNMSICLANFEESLLPFCCLLKSRIF